MQTPTETPSHLILVVEEDDATRAFLTEQLTADGYVVYATVDPESALELCATFMPDAALIDVNGGSGRTFAATVRQRTRRDVDPRLPMILMGTTPDELDAVRAFDAGADDYVRKPFSYPELRARVSALVARADTHSRRPSMLAVGDLRVNATERRVTLRGQEVHLSKKEFGLLWMLAADPMRVFTKDELLSTIWGHHGNGSTRTLDSHACRLRRKLAVHGDRFITNVWGVGYRLLDAPVVERSAALLAVAA